MGKVNCLVNNAGITGDKLLRMKEEEWDQVIQVNLKSVFNCTKTVIRHMLKNRRKHREHILRRRSHGQCRSGQLCCQQGGNHWLHEEHCEGIWRTEYQGECRGARVHQDQDDRRARPRSGRRRRSKPFRSGGSGETKMWRVLSIFCFRKCGSYITGEVINVNGGLHM